MQTDKNSCPYCGNSIQQDDNVCIHCGKIFFEQILLKWVGKPLIIVIGIIVILSPLAEIFMPILKILAPIYLLIFILIFAVDVVRGITIRRAFHWCDAFPPSHDCQNWAYEAAGRCEQVGTCRLCKAPVRRVIHESKGDWLYRDEHSCYQSQVCCRCGETEQRLVHARWSEWKYENEQSCYQSSVCFRCGEVEHHLFHAWSVWQYENEHSCNQSRVCDRCGEQEDRVAEHSWVFLGDEVEWVDSYDYGETKYHYSKYRCSRCGEEKWV